MNPRKTSSSVSRRSFMRMASVAASLPVFTEAHFAWADQQTAQQSAPSNTVMARRTRPAMPKDAVLT